MKLRNKITAATTGIGLILLALGVSGSWNVLKLQRLNSHVLDVNVSSVRAAEAMEMNVREMRHELDRFLLTKDREHLVTALKMRDGLNSLLDTASIMSASNQEKSLVLDIQNGLEDFSSQLAVIVNSPIESVSTDTVEHLEDDKLTQQVLVAAHQYLDLNEEELQQSNQENQAMAERLALVFLLLGTCGAVAGLVSGYGVARGISRSILQLSVPIRDVAGKLDEVVGPIKVSADPSVTDLETVLQTVSDNVEAVVEQLNARHREVVRSDQLAAVGQLAAGLAHELRNPLMCVKTLVQSARRQGELASLNARDLTVVDEEISRVESLVQAFIDFARPAKLEPHAVNVVRIVRQLVELVSSRAEACHIEVVCHLPNEAIVVQGDAAQLRQVVLNLLLNALDAVQNEGSIWITAEETSRPSRDHSSAQDHETYLSLRVADNGCGLPANDRQRIYEPFFSTKETGLGLGLAISQRLVESHHGELRSLDRDGGGAIFEVILPAQFGVESENRVSQADSRPAIQKEV